MTLPYYPFYWGDYSAKTFNLTQGQHGAYMLLLRHIYTEGTQISVKQCYSIAKAMLPEERENVDFVLEHYFVKEGDFWVNRKSIEVMSEWAERHQRRVIAGKKTKKQCLRKATVKLKQPEPEPEPDIYNTKQRVLGDWDVLEKRCREAAGWENDPSPNLFVIGPIVSLIEAKCDLELDILPTIKAIAPQCKGTKTWKFFLAQIQRNRDDRLGALSPPNPSKPNGVHHGKASRPNTIAHGFEVIDAAIAAERERIDRLRAEIETGRSSPEAGGEGLKLIP